VTICTHRRACILGDVINSEMRLNEFGVIVNDYWNEIPGHFLNVGIDVFIVMPNHVHGIIALTDNCRGGVSPPNSGGEATSPLRKHTLGQVIAYFKYQTTKSINRIRNTPGTPLWQRNYYEHVIRNENDIGEIREYIVNNPLKWELDRENPKNVGVRCPQ
jgi:putative transposase